MSNSEETPEIIYGKRNPLAEGEGSYEAGTLRYDKSFTARLIQSEDVVKHWYTELKNCLLSYKKVKDRMSWKRETYKCGRELVAKMSYRGKTLCLFLPLDPYGLEEKYKVEDASDNSTYSETPCMYRIKNERRVKYAMQLISMVMENLGVAAAKRDSVDYYLPYEGLVELINKGLIKRIIKSSADEAIFVPDNQLADELSEEIAQETVEETVEESVEEETNVEKIIRYNRSFTAKFILSNDDIKQWYSTLKNELLSYGGVDERMGWVCESFRFNDNKVAKFGFRGKTLCLFLPINIADYDNAKYTLNDVSAYNGFADTPSMYRIQSEKRVNKAIELISDVMAKAEIQKQEREEINYYRPYQSEEDLIEQGLIRIEEVLSENQS